MTQKEKTTTKRAQKGRRRRRRRSGYFFSNEDEYFANVRYGPEEFFQNDLSYWEQRVVDGEIRDGIYPKSRWCLL